MPDLIVPRALMKQVIDHCIACYPDEACGILSGSDNTAAAVHCMTNIEPSPVSYYMDPLEQFAVMKQMRKAGTGMVAIYHSHPQSPAYPSPKDVGLAFYPDAVYMIIGLSDRESPEIRAFTIQEGSIDEVPVVMTHD